MYDYNARYYDPALGRLISADTIVPDPANPQSLNRYAYVYNNPLRYTDPSGHCVFGVDTVVCFAVAGAAIGASIGYGVQVVDNMNQGMEFRDALTTDIQAKPIVAGGLLGGAIGAVVPAAVVVVGGVAAVGGAEVATATGATLCGDGDCFNEVTTVVETGTRIVEGAAADGDPTNEVSPFGELLYQFNEKNGGFRNWLRRGESEMSLVRASDFSSPAEALRATLGRNPNATDMYRVTNVGTAWYHRFYPVYDSMQNNRPFGHVSLYSASRWDPETFGKLFDPRLFGPSQSVLPQ